jgi:hypothetical protein
MSWRARNIINKTPNAYANAANRVLKPIKLKSAPQFRSGKLHKP